MLLILVLSLIGLIGSFLSGILGMGGAIINYPMLLFIPPLLGVANFTPQEVSGMSMVQVFFTTLAGVMSYRKTSFLSRDLIKYMGISCLVGSLIGGIGASSLSGDGINLIYLLLALVATVLMFIPTKGDHSEEVHPIIFSKPLAMGSALIVGILSGIVGAGGSFILIPIMLTLLKIPTRVTIASSLGIVFLSSIGGTVGKLISGDILLIPTAIVAIASIAGAPLGALISRYIPTKTLRVLLASLIVLSSFKMALDFYQHSSLLSNFK